MHSVLALVRSAFLAATSYRLATAFSLLALLLSAVPLYFVASALQPVAAASIAAEGGHYFGFLLTGIAATYILAAAVTAVPGAIAGGIGSGTLESLLVTRTPLPVLLIGLSGYPLLLGIARASILLIAAAVVGVDIAWTALPFAMVFVALLIVAYGSIGIIAAALVLVFRTSGPLITAVIAGSGLLGGVYYSTTVIPDWLQDLSMVVPLTYALRGMRMLLLGGAGSAEVINDLSAMVFITVGSLFVSLAVFGAALRHARHAGSLSQY